MSIEVRVPSEEVVRPGSEEILAPFSAQDRVSGSSPVRTKQINWANSPSLSTSLAKLNGTNVGGSVNRIYGKSSTRIT